MRHDRCAEIRNSSFFVAAGEEDATFAKLADAEDAATTP